MSKKWLVALVAVSVLAAAGCSSKPDRDKVPDESPLALYHESQEMMANGNIRTAITRLEAIMSRYPFGPHADQVQLDLIYAYYRAGDHDKALANIDRFIQLNPTHPNIDYVMYIRGLVHMDMDKQFFQDLFHIDRTDRDPSNYRQAFKDFAKLLKAHPDSKYAKDASKRMVFIKDRLARYEVTVGRYYLRREAYLAAANRGKYIMENFADTPSLRPALEMMVVSYDHLGLKSQRENARRVLRLNFPDSPLARD